jgi:hypothetical protein
VTFLSLLPIIGLYKMTETTQKNPKQTSRNKKSIEVKKENVYLPVVLILVSFVLQFSFYSFDEGDYGVKNNLFGVCIFKMRD